MKFVNDKLIMIFGEKDLLTSHLFSFRYIEVAKDVLETSSQALEIVNGPFVEGKYLTKKVNSFFVYLESARSTMESESPEG